MHGLPSRRRALGALCALSLVGMGPVLRAQAAGLGHITVAVGTRSAQPLRQLPLSVAEQLDFFRLEGLEVTTLDYASDMLALQALKQGVADVAAVGFEHALPTAAVPQGLRSLVLQTRVPQMALAVSSKAAPTHRSVADLRHARVGIADFGSLGHA
ncbi:MAG TPA: ABC transporter substrate-binding protein, partial [Giesbergeria sp.]|nr:ABC transporter substrate-binding protein [Giesbergeria sp.]